MQSELMIGLHMLKACDLNTNLFITRMVGKVSLPKLPSFENFLVLNSVVPGKCAFTNNQVS